jgi:hypothetical protein
MTMGKLVYWVQDPRTETTFEEPTRKWALSAATSLAKHGPVTVFCLEERKNAPLPELVGQITVEVAGVGFAFQDEGRTQ